MAKPAPWLTDEQREAFEAEHAAENAKKRKERRALQEGARTRGRRAVVEPVREFCRLAIARKTGSRCRWDQGYETAMIHVIARIDRYTALASKRVGGTGRK